jgi:serine/threonine-protein kinase HipA
MRQLYVYMNDTKAGLLTELHPGRGYVFQYDEEYLRSSLPAVSVTLPKRAEPYRDDYLFPLFTNIIPEGGNRRIICRDLRIDEQDFFGILSAMAGADFIGAVNVRKVDEDD